MTRTEEVVRRSSGSSIASILSQAWRDPAPPSDATLAQLESIAPIILSSGCAGLAWRRIRAGTLAGSEVAYRLHQAYRFYSLQAALNDRKLQTVMRCLASAGIRAVLGKGWAAARMYPEAGLRPYGDFDLYVSREQHAAAAEALKRPEIRGIAVDLHRGFAELDDRTPRDILDRCQTESLGEAEVTVFGAEDHLRLLALHMLRHGAWRPLWLCDIAVALESRDTNFKWDYFGGGDARRAEWVSCALLLAIELLGASLDQGRLDALTNRLPRWLVPTVLRQWSAPPVPHGLRTPMASYLQHPAAFVRALFERWPNGIEATVDLKGKFNEWPRLPYQVGECVLRTARFALQLRKSSDAARE